MKIQSTSAKLLSATLAVLLCVTPEMWGQQTSQQPNAQPSTQNAPAQPSGSQNTQAQPNQGQNPANQPANNGTTVNPSQGPLQPVTTYPEASGTEQNEPPPDLNPQTVTLPEAPKAKQQPSQPVGAATAEKVPTAGGAAAKPAGAAIAPAKQHQTRSLLIKIGAIAAAGVAAGTIFALSRGTSSKPPGAQ
jgi:cytoskeletal protein RodZ